MVFVQESLKGVHAVFEYLSITSIWFKLFSILAQTLKNDFNNDKIENQRKYIRNELKVNFKF